MASQPNFTRNFDQLASLLLDLFNDFFELRTLSLFLTQGSISLIAYWCPVSLLNSDIKLLAKTLDVCLDTCLINIISKDQNGFIRGRQLSSNIRCLLNIILLKPESQDPEMEIPIDAEKAFDRVEWNYLYSVLNSFFFVVVLVKMLSCGLNCYTAPQWLV